MIHKFLKKDVVPVSTTVLVTPIQTPSPVASAAHPFYFDPTYKFVPEELKSQKIWLIFGLTWSDEKRKFDKKPFNPLTRQPANNPALGVTFEQAFSTLCEWNKPEVRFVLGIYVEPPLTVVDMDNCRDPLSGAITKPEATEVSDELSTYTESSISGTGVHGIVIGKKPGTKCRKGDIEIYSQARALTVSGLPIAGTPAKINRACDPTIALIYEWMVGGKFESAKQKQIRETAESESSSESVKAHEKRLRHYDSWVTKEETLLMTGGFTENATPFVVDDGHNLMSFDSQSEAIASLLYHLARKHDGDTAKMEQDFLSSALYEGITKWNGPDGKWARLRETELANAVKLWGSNNNKPTPNIPMESVPSSQLVAVSVSPVCETLINGKGEDTGIPPFNPSVMRGLAGAMAELVTRGTTISPQFAYEDAKTYLGLRMAGLVRLEGNDFEPRRYTVSLGETGSSKSESFKRLLKILQPEGAISNICGVQIIHGYDSGPGLKDEFFRIKEANKDPRILCFVDEITEMGNQSAESRNPSVTDAFIHLYDSTHCSRVLAHKTTKTMDNARFAAILCAPSGEAVMSAFPGKNSQGLMDRMMPEFGVSQESGDLPSIDPVEAMKLMHDLDSLRYDGTIAMPVRIKARFEDFWRSQTTAVRKKNRLRLHLQKDILITAFGVGRREVTSDILDGCFEIFTRGLVIREKSFSMEIPSRVGFYVGKIKAILEDQEKQLKRGIPQERAALSERDFATLTHAYDRNEEEFFERAWKLCHRYKAPIPVQRKNGQRYEKWLPANRDEE